MEIVHSLFHNYYVPPVIFASTRDDSGEEVKVCVDGKQRLTSIQKFMDGHVRHAFFVLPYSANAAACRRCSDRLCVRAHRVSVSRLIFF